MALADTSEKLDLREPINNLDLQDKFGADNVLIKRTAKGTEVVEMVDSGFPASADLAKIPKGSTLQSTTGKFYLNDANGNWVEVAALDSSGIGLTVPSHTDANRGAAGTAGRLIFNTDDGTINVDDGTNWTDAAGVTT